MKILKGIGIGIFIVLAIALYILIVMELWNWIMPKVFGLSTISYLETAGIILLCKLLFGARGKCKGNKNNHHKKRHWKNKLKEKLNQSCENQKTTDYE
jgi:hypothetical protein